jgi:hypothetical protein
MYNHKIVDSITGEETVIPLSAQEIAIIEKNIENAKQEEIKANEAALKREAALAKLSALGLEPDDLRALGF